MIQYDFYLIKFLSRFFSFGSLLGWNLPHTLTTGFLGSRWSWRPKRRKSWGEWCVSVYGLEKGKERDFLVTAFPSKKWVLHVSYFSELPLCKIHSECCLTGGEQGGETPTSQHRDPSALNTCGSNSLPLLTEWIITPHSSLPLCMRSILHPLDLEAQLWLGLPNGRWAVVTLVAELTVLRVGLLACSCDALWAELAPQSHCPSIWASGNEQTTWNRPKRAWSLEPHWVQPVSAKPGAWRDRSVSVCHWDLEVFLLVIVQSLGRVQLFATPWTAAHQASLSLTISWSLLKLMSISSSVAPFSCPQSFPASGSFPMNGLFTSGS